MSQCARIYQEMSRYPDGEREMSPTLFIFDISHLPISVDLEITYVVLEPYADRNTAVQCLCQGNRNKLTLSFCKFLINCGDIFAEIQSVVNVDFTGSACCPARRESRSSC